MKWKRNKNASAASAPGVRAIPYPPPPGVSITKTSPGRIMVSAQPPRSSTVPSARSTELRPTSPGSLPFRPTNILESYDRAE